MSKTAAVRNLNEALINDGTNRPTYGLGDNSVRSGNIRCYFRDLQGAFLDELAGADAVVGCVAWLTNEKILRALARLRSVSVVVQKEDFLRPDHVERKELRSMYAALRNPYARFEMPLPICELSTAGSPEWDAVRCVGNVNRTTSPVNPRMHNKFAVFCKLRKDEDCLDEGDGRHTKHFMPYKAWTGSFNFTHVGCLSLENAVVIDDPKIVSAYFAEWAQISCLSEPLDWFRDWVEPEHRIGS